MKEQRDIVYRPRSAPALHWNAHARRWANLGPPLRPGPEDIHAYQAEVLELAFSCPSPKALLLGVTPEIACMNWPGGVFLLAADHAVGMVEGVWPRDKVSVAAFAVVGEWRALPLADASVDFVVGDGSFNSLDSPASRVRLSKELLRVLKPDGRLAARVYVRPDPPETAAAVFDDLLENRIGSFDAFKLRLLMAVAADADDPVPLDRVWTAWAAAAIDRMRLSAVSGWPLASIDTIDAYRANPARYNFPSLAEFRRTMQPHFTETALYEKTYELGACCPTLSFRPRP